MTDEKKDPEKIPENEDLLFGGQVKPYEKSQKAVGCCRCTKKKLLILAVVLGMLLLYGIGLAIGLAVGLSRDEEEKPQKPEDVLEPVGAVVSDHEACSDIGRDILARYGTAVDAAIATLICNGVRTPHSMGIGGGCTFVIFDKESSGAATIDGQAISPASMTENKYTRLSVESINARRIAVPGELKAYKEAHTRYGRLPWKDLFEPTIQMIRAGFPLSGATADALKYLVSINNDQYLTKFPGLCEIFCANTTTGEPKKAGDTILWPKLADTLQGVADEGVDYIYDSPLTNTIVDEIRKEGGILDISDFIMKYEVKTGNALEVYLDNSTLYTMDGATGGPIVALILNILKRYEWLDMNTLEGEVDFYHKLIEAMKFSDADRMRLGDPDFDNTTWILEKMRSEEYADILRTKITEKTHEKPYYTDATGSFGDLMGTSQVSVLSPYGDAVSVTSTVNWYFGSMIVSNATGIIWNNEMDDFDTDPARSTSVNRIEPGKRPRSSMAPCIVVDNQDNVKLVTGGAGGSKIATSVAQLIAKTLLLGMPLNDAVDSKRLHHTLKDNQLSLEKGFPEEIKRLLTEERGHRSSYSSSNIFSVIESILVDDKGALLAYADPRKLSGKASYMYTTVKQKS
ncbi:glutathione hydrolase 1 proenzyme-like isoform X2 [Mercenaria mercenaria]|uniref:glutathione hydrolase 1 proenzyme-like isoform X2 n=1 Tax=Mercenaria mercenaria TaxID=6596 RepID=UPI00234EFE08|nr:glutathione hydrolase 1 proenzyme-like isoform X2 [Mercenaria mercenaria]